MKEAFDAEENLKIDRLHGDRSAGVKDASENQWSIATHIEDVSPEEMQRRYARLNKKVIP